MVLQLLDQMFSITDTEGKVATQKGLDAIGIRPNITLTHARAHTHARACARRVSHLKQACQFRIPVGHMGGALLTVPQGGDDIPQGQQAGVDAHALLQLFACCACNCCTQQLRMVFIIQPDESMNGAMRQ